MEFIKERNFIVAYYFGERQGAWDITTGQFIGKSGKPVKTVPSCFVYRNLPSTLNNNNINIFGYAIKWYRDEFNDSFSIYNANRGENFEKLLSVGLFPYYTTTLDENIVLNKNIINYVKNDLRGRYDSHRVNQYLVRVKYEKYVEILPEWAREVFTSLISELPYDYIKSILNRIINERVDAMWDEYTKIPEIKKLIKDYYTISINLYGKVEVEKNILTKYAILKYLDEEYRTAHYNEILKKNNDQPWLYYENEIFIAKPILTKEDFHNESERQHNCVERMYMKRVYNGATHIVTIRRKSEPDKNYITCEIDNYGKIIQYLAAFNSRPDDTDAIQFYSEYANHLNKSRH